MISIVAAHNLKAIPLVVVELILHRRQASWRLLQRRGSFGFRLARECKNSLTATYNSQL